MVSSTQLYKHGMQQNLVTNICWTLPAEAEPFGKKKKKKQGSIIKG